MKTKHALDLLFEAWDCCDDEDKSIEYMFQYMSNMSGIEYDDVVQFVINTTDKERKDWYKNKNNENTN